MDSRYILKRGLGDSQSATIAAQAFYNANPGSSAAQATQWLQANTSEADGDIATAVATTYPSTLAPSTSTSFYTPQVAATTNQLVSSTGQVLSAILPSILAPHPTGSGLAIQPRGVVTAPSSFPWGTLLLVGGAGAVIFMLARRRK